VNQTKTEQGAPPGGGRQDHDAMRAASMRPVAGPASNDLLAAGGGLNVPGGDREHHVDVPDTAAVREPIPGERDATTLTHREVGAMGTLFNANAPQSSNSTLDEETLHDREIEGGGEERERPHATPHEHRHK
jgi:hypothetical protein